MKILTTFILMLALSAASAAVCPGNHVPDDSDPWSSILSYTADENANQIFFYAVDGTLIEWNTQTDKRTIIKDCLHSVRALAFSSRQQLLVVGDSGGGLELITIGAIPRTIFSEQFDDGIDEVTFSPSDQEILISQRRSLRLWNLPARKEIWRRETDNDVTRAVFGPDNSQIAVSLGSKILMLAVKTGEKRNLFEMAEIRPLVSDLAFSKSGDRLVAAVNNDLVIFNPATGKREKTYSATNADLIAVTLIRGGEQGVTVSENKTIQKWDLLKGSILFSWNLPMGLVARNGNYLVNTTEHPGQIEVWQLSPQRRLHMLQYHSPKDSATPSR